MERVWTVGVERVVILSHTQHSPFHTPHTQHHHTEHPEHTTFPYTGTNHHNTTVTDTDTHRHRRRETEAPEDGLGLAGHLGLDDHWRGNTMNPVMWYWETNETRENKGKTAAGHARLEGLCPLAPCHAHDTDTDTDTDWYTSCIHHPAQKPPQKCQGPQHINSIDAQDDVNDGDDRDRPQMADDDANDSQALTSGDITLYRALVARISYLSQDRPDLNCTSQICLRWQHHQCATWIVSKRIRNIPRWEDESEVLVPLPAEW